MHEQLLARLDTPDDAFAALERAKGTVILKNPADATSSGASGDSNAVASGLLARGYEGTILASTVDPNAVSAAKRVGIGQMVTTEAGGKLDTRQFRPLPITARVHMLTEELFVSKSNGTEWNSGESAVLKSDTETWVVTSRAVSLFDRSLLYAHGQDPLRFEAVVVQSPYCQPHFFDAWADVVLNLNMSGSTSANLLTLGHIVCTRPIFPLDDDVRFSPAARIYRRQVGTLTIVHKTTKFSGHGCDTENRLWLTFC